MAAERPAAAAVVRQARGRPAAAQQPARAQRLLRALQGRKQQQALGLRALPQLVALGLTLQTMTRA
jgi:hypothetical protein